MQAVAFGILAIFAFRVLAHITRRAPSCRYLPVNRPSQEIDVEAAQGGWERRGFPLVQVFYLNAAMKEPRPRARSFPRSG